MNDIHCWKRKFQPCYYSNRLCHKILQLNQKVSPQKRVNLLEIKKAIYYAKKYHGTQIRDSGEPFYSHPLEVAFMVADHIFETDILVTSILHDTIEDTHLTQEMIATIFNPKIAEQVNDLTRIKFNQKISIAEMIDLLWLKKNKKLLLVKCADRIHNLQTIQF